MSPWQIRNKINEIRSYIASPYCDPSQAKILYAEREKLEKMLEEMENDPQKQT